MRLTDEELRDVLARAEEIQASLHGGVASEAEREVVLQAGEAVGLQRVAVEQALRERFSAPLPPPSPGDLVFAASVDDKYYVAEVVSVSADSARVRFLWGSEHAVPLADVRRAAFLPGERIMCDWPWWGPWKCTVVRYDAARGRVKVSDGWGSTRSFPVAEVWVESLRDAGARLVNRSRLRVTLLSWGAAAGGAAGALITWLLMR